MRIQSKTVADSEVTMTEVVYPNDANPMGMLQGGRLVQWMDTASAVCAQTHAGRIAVTALLDKVMFINPAKVGDIVTIKANLTAAFKSSMEIFVQAWARKVVSGETYNIGQAFFTFVALDANASPAVVPDLRLTTKVEEKNYGDALQRKLERS